MGMGDGLTSYFYTDGNTLFFLNDGVCLFSEKNLDNIHVEKMYRKWNIYSLRYSMMVKLLGVNKYFDT